jgi:uncharacterized membrane protein
MWIMAPLDLAVVRYREVNAAGEAFAAARDRSGADAAWVREVGLMEHHPNGHLILRGTFAGHYVDVDEALHVSERGAAEGAVGGALIGVLGGPPGFAVGIALGLVIGSQFGRRSEVDPEPSTLADQLRADLPTGSGIVIIAPAGDIDEMLTALGEHGGDVIRETLTDEQVAALEASLSGTPAASRGPSWKGEEAVEASEPGPA